MHSYIRPNTHILLRLPSGTFKVLEIQPNTTVNIGKFGSFPANLLLGRPYYFTFELLDKDEGKERTELRVVPASELHAEALNSGDHATPAESREESTNGDGGVEFDIVGEDGEVIMRSNRMTVDDPSRQTLSMEEIEELKKAGTGSGKDIIARIMASHMGIDEKTSFSLAKYTLRKSKKYLRRFTVLPLDVGMLTEYITERESHKIMELREEMLGLIVSWANVHCGASSRVIPSEDGNDFVGGGRWLVVDDTGGLVVAALAEKMGTLYPHEESDEEDEAVEQQHAEDIDSQETPDQNEQPRNGDQHQHEMDTVMGDASSSDIQPIVGSTLPDGGISTIEKSDITASATSKEPGQSPTCNGEPQQPRKAPRTHIAAMSAKTNTLTLLHSNNQPNLGLLKYFSFDASNPTPAHPLHTHLKSLSWLQLLDPASDPSYSEPPIISDSFLSTWKSSKRGAYYKKRRRWEKVKRVVDETRAGGYDGLVVASVMEPASVLKELVPLVRGGGQVVVYRHDVESLVELCDFYSKERKTAYVAKQNLNAAVEGNQEEVKTDMKKEIVVKKEKGVNGKAEQNVNGTASEDETDSNFPVNPTLLLAPMLQTARARHWQVLPGRTHPMMTSRGGAEGYLFTATRVLPVEGKVEARGRFRGKKRKMGEEMAAET